jgi:hypothetical protein
MIENEIQITLIGTLVVVLITIYQIWVMSRAKFKHHQTMLKLENSLNTGEKLTNQQLTLHCKSKNCSLFCNGPYLMQIIFGILVFISFTCWAVYLVSVAYIEWAPLPGSLALIGLMTPIIAWRGFKHRRQAEIQLIHDIEISQKAGLQEDQLAAEQRIEVKQVAAEPETIAKPEPVREVLPDPVDIPDPIAITEPCAEIQVKPIIIEKQKLPQDSILKRHFLSHLRCQIESCHPSRPSDSILKRHFDSFIATEMEKYVDGTLTPAITSKSDTEASPMPKDPDVASATEAPVTTEPQSSASSKTLKQQLPQDSILKRHYLTKIQFDIESVLPPRPTDSILKRHYDSLIATEMLKRLEKTEA